jgi:crotonobetainyl-CoA hydratase
MNHIKVVRDGPVTQVELNRPEVLNAITAEMHDELQAAFDDFAVDPEQRVCIITGAGDRAFCAGTDVKAAVAAGPGVSAYPRSGYAGLTERFDCNKPFIAAVNGLALGGGFEIVLACDIVIASEDASFGLPEPLIGAIALAGGLHRLAQRLPINLAMGMILTSRAMSARDALQHGLVNELVAPDELMAAARRWGDDILRASPVATQMSKAIVRRGLAEPDLETALRNQSGYPEFTEWKTSQDFHEGIQAFAERRAPRWSGR